MSDRFACPNYVPQGDAFGWADAVLHPGLSIDQVYGLAMAFAFVSPLKIFVPPCEDLPRAWLIVQSLWSSLWSFDESGYTVREDARCRMPPDTEVAHGHLVR